MKYRNGVVCTTGMSVHNFIQLKDQILSDKIKTFFGVGGGATGGVMILLQIDT